MINLKNASVRKKRPGKASGSFHIVGIGASAGGIEAYKTLFKSLEPVPNAAIVCILHLPVSKKTSLVETFTKAFTHLHFDEIRHGKTIRPETVYFNVTGSAVSIDKRKFRVAGPVKNPPMLTVDHFFRSLAAQRRCPAIAVVLSGAGSDGALGIREIKAAGGVVIVQKPSTAEFESMPAIAVSTGFSDYVLPPQEIGPKVKQCVERLSSGPVSDAGASLDLSTIHRESLFNLLLGKTHIHFEHYKKNVVARRVYRRMGLTAVPSPDKYIALLHEDPNEVSSLANDLMIGVTGFFRDPDAWEVLKKDLIKDLAANGQADKPLRVWVPACSTGEEAYSIAMALHLETELSGKPRPIHVFATDINEKALHYARKGIYPASISADVPAEYLRRYFTAQHDGVSMRINKNVRDIVAFARQNVLTDPPFSKLDLIVCRNLFIYLEPQAQEKCLGLFHYALNPEGHLFMGNAESVGKRYALFKPAGNKKCRLYIRVNSDGSHWNAPPLQTVPVRHPIGATVWPLAPGDQSIQSVAQRALLEKYAPAVVAIDEASTIVYFNGPTNKFLSQPGGKPTNKLLNQVPENVRIGLRRLISQVMHDDVTRTLRASFPGENRRVTISVSRLTEENKLSAVSFEEKAGKGPVEETAADSGGTDEPVIRQLEHELAITRDDLQSHIEQLKSLNEEMHSSNEELQASNEELETSQEELQSVNEELVTVNTQLQDTVEAQTATNNDLSNFFVSTDIPTLFLDRDLRIKRFTPAMTRLVNLIDADVGRPFIELAQNNIGPELSADAVEVLGKLSAVTREVECGGTWFIRQALPYRTSDNRIEGVVVTFVDITRRKKDEDEIRVLAKFPSENPNPILRISRECVVLYANEAGRPLLDMWKCSCGDKVPEAWRRTIGEIFDKGDERTVEIQCGDQIYSFVIVPIANAGYVNWYGRNVTKRKHAEEELIENESKYRGLFENMTEEVHFWKLVRDNEGRIVTWRLVDANPPTLKTWGKDRDQILGKTTDEIFGPGSTEHYMPIVEKIFNEGKPYSYEDYFPQLDKYFRFTSVPMAEHFITTGADITGIKKSEEALRQSEDRFRVIAETVPALVCVTRAEDAIVLFTNEVNNKAFGLRGEEIIGTKGPDYYCDPADRKKMVDLFKKEGFVDGYRLKVKKADGTPFWIMTSVRSLVYNGQLAMIGASIDITEYKRLEDQLRVQADILQSVADAVVVTDLSFTIISWNEPAKRIYGWNAEEALGKPIKDVVRSEMSDEKRMAIYKSAQEGEANFTEVVQRTKDGRAIYVECHSMPLRDSTGVITGFVTVNRDVSERRRAEEALRNNVRLLEDVMDGCPSPIFLKDNEGKFITINASLEKMLGKSRQELKGKTDYDIAPKAVADFWRSNDTKVMETGNAIQIEEVADLQDGRHIFLANKFPLINANGQIYGIGAISHDITNRKRMEEQLNVTLRRFYLILSNLHTGILLVSDDNRVEFANQPFCDAFGLKDAPDALMNISAEEMIEKIRPSYIDPNAAIARIAEIVNRGQPVHGEDVGMRGERTFLRDYIPIRFNEKQYGRLWIHLDITQRKKAEDALRVSEEKYRLLVQYAPAGIYEVDFTTGKFTEVNDVMCSLLGYTHEELLAVTAFDILDDEGKAHFSSRIREARSGKRLDETVEYRVRKKDGGFIWGLLNSRFKLKDGNITGASVIAYDITERKKAEEEIRRHAEELRKSNQELERFNRAMVDRELRMVELKKQINELCAKLGEPPRFAADFDDE